MINWISSQAGSLDGGSGGGDGGSGGIFITCEDYTGSFDESFPASAVLIFGSHLVYIKRQGKATVVQDRSEKCLKEEGEILNRWREYCS